MAQGWMVENGRLVQQLQLWLDEIATEDGWQIHLYQNDHTATPGDEVIDYVEATFNGYAAVDIDTTLFGAAAIVANVAISTSSEVASFVHDNTGVAQTIYGYYYTDGDDELVAAESFAVPIVLNLGQSINITPRFKHGNTPVS